jgi:hypothetical protein
VDVVGGYAAASAVAVAADQTTADARDARTWHYEDDSGQWQGPFATSQLRAWRAALPMELRVVGGEGGEANRATTTTTTTTMLAAVLGDDELVSRAAALDVRLPPRATATQAEAAISTVLSMRASLAGDGGAAGAAGTAAVAEAPASAEPPGLSAPADQSSRQMAAALIANLPASQRDAVLSGGVDPADMARALLDKMQAQRHAVSLGIDGDWAGDGYESKATYNKLTGHLTAGPSTVFGRGPGRSVYAGTPLDHHMDVNQLEAAMCAMKRRREKAKNTKLTREEVERLKQRKADVKKKMFKQNNRWLFDEDAPG